MGFFAGLFAWAFDDSGWTYPYEWSWDEQKPLVSRPEVVAVHDVIRG